MRTPNHWQNNNLVSRLLMPLGWIYFQLSCWRHKIARNFDIGVPVICVGNIVAGGAGKTPTAMYLGKLLSKRFKVAFLTRGYGGALSGPIKVDPDKHTFQDVGDEALLLSKIAPTWVSKNRLESNFPRYIAVGVFPAPPATILPTQITGTPISKLCAILYLQQLS